MTGDDHDLEEALRATLAERAGQIPDPDAVARRTLARIAEVPPTAGSRRFVTFTLPLIAACAVVALAVTVAVVANRRHTSGHPGPLAQGTLTTSATVDAPPQSSAPATSTGSAPSPEASHMTVIGLTGFHATDLSFVGGNDGWALGTADCLTSAGTCVGMLRTRDGTTWTAVPNPPVNVAGVTGGCSDPCVTNIRFANDRIGYAFGPSALLMTIDGGQTWHRQAGGALALETLAGNVIRVSSGCLPGCPATVQVAPIGSATWQSVALPGRQPSMASAVALVRTGSSAYLDVFGHVAGGAQSATSVLYSSDDNGQAWTRRGEPCPQIGGGLAGNEVDSTALTAAPDGSVTLVCVPRGGGRTFVVTSTNGGRSFSRSPATLGAAAVSLVGAGSAEDLFVMSDVLDRSTDGGRTWQRVDHQCGYGCGPIAATWIGFESPTVGRVLEPDANGGGAHTLWTTRDGGATWKAYTFS